MPNLTSASMGYEPDMNEDGTVNENPMEGADSVQPARVVNVVPSVDPSQMKEVPGSRLKLA